MAPTSPTTVHIIANTSQAYSIIYSCCVMCMLLDEANLINVVYNYKNVMKKDGGISALPSFACIR
jgi:hypothetical protein